MNSGIQYFRWSQIGCVQATLVTHVICHYTTHLRILDCLFIRYWFFLFCSSTTSELIPKENIQTHIPHTSSLLQAICCENTTPHYFGGVCHLHQHKMFPELIATCIVMVLPCAFLNLLHAHFTHHIGCTVLYFSSRRQVNTTSCVLCAQVNANILVLTECNLCVL